MVLSVRDLRGIPSPCPEDLQGAKSTLFEYKDGMNKKSVA
tara:strand:- start:43 stop:162 length:120 start_codon:yes stop_codon:yes gene_type:complete